MWGHRVGGGGGVVEEAVPVCSRQMWHTGQLLVALAAHKQWHMHGSINLWRELCSYIYCDGLVISSALTEFARLFISNIRGEKYSPYICKIHRRDLPCAQHWSCSPRLFVFICIIIVILPTIQWIIERGGRTGWGGLLDTNSWSSPVAYKGCYDTAMFTTFARYADAVESVTPTTDRLSILWRRVISHYECDSYTRRVRVIARAIM